MLTHNLNGHKVEVYNSIMEMPIGAFLDLQIYSTIDAGVGTNVEEIHAKIKEGLVYNQAGRKKDVERVLLNIAQSYELIFGKVSLKLLSFICFVKSIDGKPILDTSMEGRQEVITKLAKWRVTIGTVLQLFAELKKKSTWKWITISGRKATRPKR